MNISVLVSFWQCLHIHSVETDFFTQVTELQLQNSDVICLQEVQEKFLLILSGYLLETTYNFYT